MALLSEILSSNIRADIFRLLFGVNESELHMREIERRSGYAIGTIQSELKKLLRLDLVTKRKDGNRTYFRANKNHPLFLDIQRLVLKTVGLVDILYNKLQNSSEILIAFVFGSIARQREMAESDVDLFVVGELGLRKLVGLLSGVSDKIGREINPHVFTVMELKKRLEQKDHFITRVLDEPKIFILGNENELGTMVG